MERNGRKTGGKEKKKKRQQFCLTKRLRDTGENPKKKLSQRAAGCGRTEHGKFCGQKEEQKRQIVVHRVHGSSMKMCVAVDFC